VYGSGVKRSIKEVLDPKLIDAVELGLSSDTEMADQIEELHRFTFVTNSDAHSLPKIGREYQSLKLDHPSFNELKLALHNEEGRKVEKNFGLNPKLGKYHRTRCADCMELIDDFIKGMPCPYCGHGRVVKGVRDRLDELATCSSIRESRPPYIHQVPLEFIPKLGPKTLQKLLQAFGTEMAILHKASLKDLIDVVGRNIAELIVAARDGRLAVETGGAGKYGKIKAH